MSIQKLPASPNLENLKKRAKALLKSANAGDEDALRDVGPYFGDPKEIGLQQAQLVMARRYGFSSWAKLKTHIERGAPDAETPDQLANRFLDLVCLAYSPVGDHGPKRFVKAAQLLEAHPEIARENIYTAAAMGDVGEIDRWLDEDPELINRKGGIFGWEPLMYAAYSRPPGVSTLAAGLRLLERGADPNAYYMWGGQYKFTALTGVFGQGESGPVAQPEHPEFEVFARALLDRGSNANDSQAAYNRFFTPDNTCLELLLEYGLAADDKNNWLLCEDDRLLQNPSETMHWQLIRSIHSGYLDRAQLMIDHGVDVDKPDDSYESRTKGKTPYQAALLLGQQDIAKMLLTAGAQATPLSTVDEFEAACMAGDVKRARQMLADIPTLEQEMVPRQRQLLCDAVKVANRDGLAAMIELGFELNPTRGRPPLHEAALHDAPDVAAALIDAGADPKFRDADYFVPPIGYAQHVGQDTMIAFFDTQEMDIFTAAARGIVSQIETRLTEDPERLNMRFAKIRPMPEQPCANDWMTPVVYAVLMGQVDAVRFFIERGADLNVSGEEQSLREIAEAQVSTELEGAAEIRTLVLDQLDS